MDDDNFERLLKVGEVAKLLGVSVSTVWRHVANGSLPEPVRFGGITRWAQSELANCLDKMKAERPEVGTNPTPHPVRKTRVG
ncbi:helix-turn-helix transcriptional regulator [Pseudooceanicola sp. MF1-13]|uniref:helix-turn-helix transcriptional regulator n=1 Tax=Pseudooceanicola sp. MF1-13 TaxID=3379095 RepID=UPI00389194F0